MFSAVDEKSDGQDLSQHLTMIAGNLIPVISGEKRIDVKDKNENIRCHILL
jgi:hypothetical protein